jgi:hypothetical protein
MSDFLGDGVAFIRPILYPQNTVDIDAITTIQYSSTFIAP